MAYLRDSPPPYATPGVMHALVIGVGKYGPDNNWDLADLDSPLVSADAFARWLLEEYRNPDAPLASVDLLWSPPGAAKAFVRPDGTAVAVEAATMDNVTAAVDRWFLRCDSAQDNVAVLYFCGHGLQRGIYTSLLLDSAGRPGRLDPSDDVICFSDFKLGMNRCRARKQVYFLDACRTLPARVAGIPDKLGRALVQLNYADLPSALTRETAVVYATAEGQSAFGEDGRVSAFTDALLSVLRGAGWDDRRRPYREWNVNTDNLATNIRALLNFRTEVDGAPQQDAMGECAAFVFHRPPPGVTPKVPVSIGCRDAGRNARFRFEVTRDGVHICEREGGVRTWECDLEVRPGYGLVADDGAAPRRQDLDVRPACEIVRLEI